MKTRQIHFISFVSGLVSVAALWLVAGVFDLARYGRLLLTYCHSLFEMCAGYAGVAGLAVLGLAVAVVVAGIVYGLARNAYRLIKASAAIKAMPKKDIGSSVVLIKDDARPSAFTWGLFRPRVYISTGLVSALTSRELRAVCLHEVCHIRSRDPLRFFLMSALSDIFVYIPVVRLYALAQRTRGEWVADDYAASRTGDALSLASALLKVTSLGAASAPVPVSFAGSGAPSERITRLLNENGGAPKPKAKRYPAWSIAASLVMASFLTVAFFSPLPANALSAGVCTTKHCALHAHAGRLAQSCKVHCAAGVTYTHMH